VRYGYAGTMRTAPGRRDDVVAILLRDVDGLKAAGCDLYLVGLSGADPDVIHVTEVWASKEHHAASLQLPATKAAIAEAMPMLTGEFTSTELAVAGGLGV
jgi:quinol monooxygenase YgiN